MNNQNHAIHGQSMRSIRNIHSSMFLLMMILMAMEPWNSLQENGFARMIVMIPAVMMNMDYTCTVGMERALTRRSSYSELSAKQKALAYRFQLLILMVMGKRTSSFPEKMDFLCLCRINCLRILRVFARSW